MSDLAINILGAGIVAPDGLSLDHAPTQHDTVLDVTPCLRDRKTLKFMAKQDQMALMAAHRAVQQAELDTATLRQRTGLYFCVGYIPFEQEPLDTLGQVSQQAGEFDMTLFATRGLNSANPLLTFKCLPNMPAYHVSANLGIHQHYFVTYPGAGQWAQCLQQAVLDLNSNVIDYAVVGAVADQRNPLVQHHMARTLPEQTGHLIDAACVFVLSRKQEASAPCLGSIQLLQVSYQVTDPIHTPANDTACTLLPVHGGCVNPSLAIALRAPQRGDFTIAYQCPDGLSARITVGPA